MIVEQRTTDLVDIEDLPHGISRLTFAFDTPRPRDASCFYASTAQIQEILAEEGLAKPVSALSDRLARWVPLNPDCTESVFTDVPLTLFQSHYWRAQGGMAQPLADPATFTGEVTPDMLVRLEGHDTLISYVTGKPISTAQIVGGLYADARNYDLDALAAILTAHPWVKGVHFEAATYYSAASLHVIVVLPQDVYETAVAALDGSRYYDLSEVLFRAPLPGGEAVPGLPKDLLGVAPALRTDTSYREPSDDWDDYVPVERYPALEESLPSLGDLYA